MWPRMLELGREEGTQYLAGWVQAIGSIGAILAAVWAVSHAHRLQAAHKTADEARQHRQFLECLFQLVGAAAQVARKAYDLEMQGNVTPGEYDSMQIELSAIHDAMRKIPVERIGSYDVLEPWLVADACVRKLLSGIQYVTSKTFPSQLEPHYLRNLANDLRGKLDARAKALMDVVDATGPAVTAKPPGF